MDKKRKEVTLRIQETPIWTRCNSLQRATVHYHSNGDFTERILSIVGRVKKDSVRKQGKRNGGEMPRTMRNVLMRVCVSNTYYHRRRTLSTQIKTSATALVS